MTFRSDPVFGISLYELDFLRLGPTLNDHVHWRQKSERAKEVRALTKAQIPQMKRIAVPVQIAYRVEWPKGKRRMDWDNLAGALKPVQDGLVDAGVVYQDGPDWVTRVTYEQARGVLPGITVVVTVIWA